MSSASGMCQAYPVYTSGAPEDVSTALHGSGESSLCTQVGAAPASPTCRSPALWAFAFCVLSAVWGLLVGWVGVEAVAELGWALCS